MLAARSAPPLSSPPTPATSEHLTSFAWPSPPPSRGRLSAGPETAEEFKALGNTRMKAGQYAEAVEAYTHSLKLGPTQIGPYLNRAAARQQLGEYKLAVTDCCVALALPGCTTLQRMKALFRRGLAQQASGELPKALADFKAALAIEPHNKRLQKHVHDAEALMS